MNKPVVGNFGAAIEALKQGRMISRLAWEGKAFVFRQVPSVVPAAIIPRMTSLPHSVKEMWAKHPDAPLHYRDQLAIVEDHEDDPMAASVRSWAPTISDLFAEDWAVFGEVQSTPEPAVAGETVGTAKPTE